MHSVDLDNSPRNKSFEASPRILDALHTTYLAGVVRWGWLHRRESKTTTPALFLSMGIGIPDSQYLIYLPWMVLCNFGLLEFIRTLFTPRTYHHICRKRMYASTALSREACPTCYFVHLFDRLCPCICFTQRLKNLGLKNAAKNKILRGYRPVIRPRITFQKHQ